MHIYLAHSLFHPSTCLLYLHTSSEHLHNPLPFSSYTLAHSTPTMQPPLTPAPQPKWPHIHNFMPSQLSQNSTWAHRGLQTASMETSLSATFTLSTGSAPGPRYGRPKQLKLPVLGDHNSEGSSLWAKPPLPTKDLLLGFHPIYLTPSKTHSFCTYAPHKNTQNTPNLPLQEQKLPFYPTFSPLARPLHHFSVQFNHPNI